MTKERRYIMEIVNIMDNEKYIREYAELCTLEWGSRDYDESFIDKKVKRILSKDKVISVLGLIENGVLMGFISLFKFDGEERQDLTPWYATMYVKEEFRGMSYSHLLNEAIILEARNLGYERLYLKSDLVNYYEKYGAKYLEDLKCGEKLYVIEL